MVLDLGGSPVRPDDIGGADGQARSARRAMGRPGSSGQLLYQRVVAHVEQLIAERGLAPGDLLPSYAELAEQVQVSLITVRRALEELERAGTVRRHQGLGTYVARPRIISEPTRSGSLLGTFASDDGTELQTRILELRKGQPSADLRQALRVNPATPVWRLRRLRLIDGRPAVLETSVIPVVLAPTLDRTASGLEGSLYGLLASEYGLVDAYEEQYLEVIAPAQDESKLLELPARSLVVRIRGLSADDAGVPFDCFEQLYLATEFAFAISGSAARRLLPAPGHRDWTVKPLPR